jgi:hypothetical protein
MVEAYPLQWPVAWPRTRHPERARFSYDYVVHPLTLRIAWPTLVATFFKSVSNSFQTI